MFEKLEETYLNRGLKGIYAKYVLHKIRIWDVMTPNRVDYFNANSKYIADRIKKIYKRKPTVIYPSVNTDLFELEENKESYYFTASRMVFYKKIKLIVETFNDLPNHQLVVGGNVPELEKIKRIAKNNIQILGMFLLMI